MIQRLLVTICVVLPCFAELSIFDDLIGCYNDDQDQPKFVYEITLPNTSDIIESCVKHCANHNFTYAGLQSVYYCFCGNSYEGLSNGVCNSSCVGNVSQICGGDVSKSVYRTGQTGFITLLKVTETSLHIAWFLPVPSSQLITNYRVAAKYVETFSSSILMSLHSWLYPNTTTKAVLLNLHPGTKYNVTVTANSLNGVHEWKSGIFWTQIGEPSPPPVPKIIRRDEDGMVVHLTPSANDNGPISAYRVVVIQDEGLTLFDPNSLTNYQEAQKKGLSYYIAAEIDPKELNDTFVVGDDRTYRKYHNPPIPIGAHVHVSLGIVSTWEGVTKVAYAKTSHEQHGVMVLDVGNPMSAEQASSSGLIIGLSVAIGVFGFLLILSMVAYFVLRQRLGRRRHIPDHQELSLEGPMIEVDSNSYVHNGYVHEEDDERVDHYENLKQQVWNIPRNFLDVKTEPLGLGLYGNVMKGTVQQRGFPVPVAIHVIADGDLSSLNKKSMLRDLDVLIRVGSFNNVVNLVGTCENPDTLFVVIEHHPATLKDALLESRCLEHSSHSQQRFCSLGETQILETAVGVARAMEYLTCKKIIHKQLAARNVILADGIVPKVTGFGIAQCHKGNEVPDFTRWTAQEIFRNHHHASKSDVWSFGCLLWEITALGGTPYVDVCTADIPARVMRGMRLPQLQMVGDDLYQLMLQCWQVDLDERPAFQEIVHILENLLDESAIHINFAVYSGFHYEQYNTELERQCC